MPICFVCVKVKIGCIPDNLCYIPIMQSPLTRFSSFSSNMRGALLLLVAALFFSLMIALIKLAGERLHVTQILLARQTVMTLLVCPSILYHFPGCLRTARLDLQVIRISIRLTSDVKRILCVDSFTFG